MGNQQERPLGVEYLAGLVEGEGCFCLAIATRVNKNGGRKVQVIPTFAIYMQDKELMERVSRAFDSLGLYSKILVRHGAGRNPQYGITAQGFIRLQAICLTFIPHLRGNKKQAARLVLAFTLSRSSKQMGVAFTEDEISMVEKLRSVNGNQRGRKTPIGILRDYTPSSRPPRPMKRPARLMR